MTTRITTWIVLALTMMGSLGASPAESSSRDRDGQATLAAFNAIDDLLGISDVQVLEIRSGSVVGSLAPTALGKYRDMLAGIDAKRGQLAVVEWKDRESLLKVISIQPWKVATHTLKLGRLNGLDGAMSYDFAGERLFFVSEGSLRVTSLNGEQQSYQVPLHPGYVISRIAVCPSAVFVTTGNSCGDYMGFTVVRVDLTDGTATEICNSPGRLFEIAATDNQIEMVHTPDRAYNDSVLVVRYDQFGTQLSRSMLNVAGWDYAFTGKYLLCKSSDDKTLRRWSLSQPQDTRDYTLAAPAGYDTYDIAGTDDYGLVMLQNENTGDRKLLRISLESGCTATCGPSSSRASSTLSSGSSDFLFLV